MQFLAPAFLSLGFLALIPLALYLFRRKARVRQVSTLVFFKTLAREHQESAWLRRLKRLLSLLVTLFVVLGTVLALARVAFTPRSDDYRTVVILLDRSASMAAREAEGGETRLESAKRRILSRLDGVPEEVGVALVAYDARPEIVLPRTLKRRELVSRLDAVEVRPVAEDRASALEAAGVLAGLETPAVIWHVTDDAGSELNAAAGAEVSEDHAAATVAPAKAEPGKPAEGVDASDAARLAESLSGLPEGVVLEPVTVAAEAASNVGFTAFHLRPSPQEHARFDVYVRVGLNRDAPGPVQARVETLIGGAIQGVRDLELEPGDQESFVLKIQGVADQMLHVQLRAENDALDTDNDLLMPLPKVRPVVVALVGKGDGSDGGEKVDIDPYVGLALQSIQAEGEMDVYVVSSSAWPPKHPVDVAVFDRWLPTAWPKDIPCIVINPSGQSGPVRARPLASSIPHDSVRVADEGHPVLFRVSSGRVSLNQSCVFDLAGSLEPLWIAGNEPVLAAGEVGGQRLVLLGFSPESSENLPLMASFPILMGNALLWCAETSPGVVERVDEARTGEVRPVKGTSATWSQWLGGGMQRSAVKLSGPLLELDRSGVWETDEGQRGAAHLLSWKETDLPGPPQADEARDSSSAAASASAKTGETGRTGILAGDVNWWIVAAILGLLVVESWLFHRWALY